MRTQITSPYTGEVYEWQKPPRHVHWRHARIARTFQARYRELQEEGVELTPEQKKAVAAERGMQLLESMTEDEAARFEAYVTDVVRSGLGWSKERVDAMPEDDLWWLYSMGTNGEGTAKVETTEGETDVETVCGFRGESTLSTVRPDVPDVPHLPVGADGDQRPGVSG